jgi:hypothetical protein
MFFRKDTKGSAADTLLKTAKIYKEKNTQYGDAFVVVGNVMSALLPGGVVLKTPQDHVRFHMLGWLVGKLVRYCQNWERGGHQDSMEDLVVYGAMLAFEDELEKKKKREEE